MDTLDAFTKGYIEAALWSSTDEHGEPLDAVHTVDDIAPATLATMIADCTDFCTANAALLADGGQSDDYNGHDFWLTRCGHGAGFWDRGLGEVGDKLTEAASAYGSVDLYVGDDGLIYA